MLNRGAERSPVQRWARGGAPFALGVRAESRLRSGCGAEPRLRSGSGAEPHNNYFNRT